MTDYSYQLYCSRDFGPLSETMKMVAGAGYTQVEGYGALYKDAAAVAQLRGLLSDNGLTMPTGHFNLDQLEADPQGVIAIARDVGMKAIYCPHLAVDERPGDADGYVAFGKRLQAASAPFREAGFAFGWHNHAFEFEALPDGSLPIARIFEGGPDLVWEIDVGWVIRAGADPVEWMSREANRIDAVHLKDIAPEGEATDEDGWADVGHGTVDWAPIVSALASTKVRFRVMEHDKPNDDRRFAERSIAAANKF